MFHDAGREARGNARLATAEVVIQFRCRRYRKERVDGFTRDRYFVLIAHPRLAGVGVVQV